MMSSVISECLDVSLKSFWFINLLIIVCSVRLGMGDHTDAIFFLDVFHFSLD